jgi:hypothetical protein
LPPSPPTDPYVPVSSIRFLARESRCRRRGWPFSATLAPTLSDRSSIRLLVRPAIHAVSWTQVSGPRVPLCFSTWLSPRGASLPSFGSHRAWFPALSGTVKALRLPTGASCPLWTLERAHENRARRHFPRALGQRQNRKAFPISVMFSDHDGERVTVRTRKRGSLHRTDLHLSSVGDRRLSRRLPYARFTRQHNAALAR